MILPWQSPQKLVFNFEIGSRVNENTKYIFLTLTWQIIVEWIV